MSDWRYELPPGLVGVVFPGLAGQELEVNQFSMVLDGSRTRIAALELWATGSSQLLAAAFDLELDAAWSDTTVTLHFDLRVWANEADALHEFGSMMDIDPFALGLVSE